MISALVLMANGTEDIESISTIDILDRAGIKVATAAVTNDGSRLVTLSHKVTVLCNFNLSDITDTYDVIVLPGGPGTKELAKSEILEEMIKKQLQEGRHVAAICAAPGYILYSKGIVTDDKMACYPGCECGYNGFTQNPVEVSCNGLVITGRGPGYAQEFALEIVKVLLGETVRKNIADDTLNSEKE
ncbi:MAG: DJ-1 family glyoxalase III [Succinivibrio sp.]